MPLRKHRMPGRAVSIPADERQTHRTRERKKLGRTTGGQILLKTLICSPVDRQTNGQINRHLGR